MATPAKPIESSVPLPAALRLVPPRPAARYRKWLVILLLAGAFPACYACMRVRMMCKAASILYSIDGQILAPRSLRMYERIFGARFQMTDVTIPGRAGPIPVRIYTPRNRPDEPVMVLVHGMAPQGYRDPTLIRLAKSMARSGLTVITPNIRSEQQMQVRFEAVTQIDDTARWAARRRNRPVSLMGVSFSGGLVIVAAAQPGYDRDIRMVFSVSGYDDIDRLGRYYIGYAESSPGSEPEDLRPPSGGSLIIALHYLNELVPAGAQPIIERAILDDLDRQPHALLEEETAMTPAQRTLFVNLETLDTPEIRRQFALLLQRHKAELAAVSPHSCLRGLKAPLFLLHGRIDPTIPLAEAEWTMHDAPKDVRVHLFVTPWMRHVTLDQYTPRYQKLRLINYTADMLRAAGLH